MSSLWFPFVSLSLPWPPILFWGGSLPVGVIFVWPFLEFKLFGMSPSTSKKATVLSESPASLSVDECLGWVILDLFLLRDLLLPLGIVGSKISPFSQSCKFCLNFSCLVDFKSFCVFSTSFFNSSFVFIKIGSNLYGSSSWTLLSIAFLISSSCICSSSTIIFNIANPRSKQLCFQSLRNRGVCKCPAGITLSLRPLGIILFSICDFSDEMSHFLFRNFIVSFLWFFNSPFRVSSPPPHVAVESQENADYLKVNLFIQ